MAQILLRRVLHFAFNVTTTPTSTTMNITDTTTTIITNTIQYYYYYYYYYIYDHYCDYHNPPLVLLRCGTPDYMMIQFCTSNPSTKISVF
jgi:hypothetical protein